MRCNSCNRFVQFDTESDPEVNMSLEGTVVSGSIEIQNNCAECGGTLTSASFDPENDHTDEIEKHAKDVGVELDTVIESLKFEEGECERTDETEGKGRGMKHFYGIRFQYEIVCGCPKCKAADAAGQKEKVFTVSGTLEDRIQSSHMDECQ